jgi:histidine triad (HIT) family protein
MSKDCLFCKIIKGEIPSKKVFENEHVIGLVDIHPQAKIHLLFIHKNHSRDINEMCGDPESISHIFKAVKAYTESQSFHEQGFRIVTNVGKHGGQTVFHTHFHVLAGEPLGPFGTYKKL